MIMIHSSEIKKRLLVRFIEGYEPSSLSHEYLSKSDVIYCRDNYIFNDELGEYVMLASGDGLNSSYAYLKDLHIDRRSFSLLPHHQVYYNHDVNKKEFLIFTSLFMDEILHFINVNRENYSPYNLKFKTELL